MKKVFKYKILGLLLVILLFGSFVLLPASTGAAGIFDGSKKEVCQGVTLDNGTCTNADLKASGSRIYSIVQTAVNVLSWIIGIVAVIMIVVGGLKYVISGGDSNAVNSAKNTLIYAIIGLVIVALSQVIVRFALDTADTAPQTSNNSRQTP